MDTISTQADMEIRPYKKGALDLNKYKEIFTARGCEVKANPFLVSVKTDNLTMTLFADGRAIIYGTKSTTEAKNLYYKFVG